MQTAEQLAAQERATGPRLVAASKAEAQSHAAFFASARAESPEFTGSVEGRHAHNMANIACGWISEAEPRYLAEFLPALGVDHAQQARDLTDAQLRTAMNEVDAAISTALDDGLEVAADTLERMCALQLEAEDRDWDVNWSSLDC